MSNIPVKPYGTGIMQDDMIIYTAIVTALEDVKANPWYINDIANQILTDPLLDKNYGAQEVEKFKDFLKKKFYVSVTHQIKDAKFPAISIALGAGSEDQAKAALGDSFEQTTIGADALGASASKPRIIVGPTTPTSYDSLTGSMTFPETASLDSVYADSMVVFDEVNSKAYPILLVMDASNLMIEEGSQPNLTGCTIRPASNNYVQLRKTLFFYNNYEIGVHAINGTELMYLFQIMMFVLLKYKKTLFEARGLEITTLNYGPVERFGPGGDNDANVIWSRTIQLRGRIGMSWPDSTDPGIMGTSPTLRIADMKTPLSVLPVVELQGWRGEGDPSDNE